MTLGTCCFQASGRESQAVLLLKQRQLCPPVDSRPRPDNSCCPGLGKVAADRLEAEARGQPGVTAVTRRRLRDGF